MEFGHVGYSRLAFRIPSSGLAHAWIVKYSYIVNALLKALSLTGSSKTGSSKSP